MYNVCTIMYTHIRSQASGIAVLKDFLCAQQSTSLYSTYHVKTNPSQMMTLI